VYEKKGEAPLRNATVTTIAPPAPFPSSPTLRRVSNPCLPSSYVRQVMDNDLLVEVHPYFEALPNRGAFIRGS
jgi:ribonucleoside-diphosphate reductase alpha chain